MAHLKLPSKPLASFSVGTALQYDYLIAEKEEIEELLEETFKNKDEIQGDTFIKCNGKIWLWTLGAYELVRTLDEAVSCLSESSHNNIHDLKIYLAKIRIPFAKQEKRGKKYGKRVYAHDEFTIFPIHETKDIGFEIEGEIVTFKELSEQFLSNISSIQDGDIVSPLESTYPK